MKITKALCFIFLLIMGPVLWAQNNEVLMPYLKGDKFGFANVDAKVIIEPKYDYVRLFENGFSSVKLDDKWGVIDETGKVIIPLVYKKIVYFNSDGLTTVNSFGRTGVLNLQGEWLVPQEYYWGEIKSNYIQVGNSLGQAALLNLKGKTIIDFEYDRFELGESSDFNPNFIIIKQDKKYGLIQLNKKKHKVMIEPQYERLKILSDGFYLAKKEEKYGVINFENEIILPFIHDDINRKDEGYLISEEKIEFEVQIKTLELDHNEFYSSRRWSDIEEEFDYENQIVYYIMTQKEQDELKDDGFDITQKEHIETQYGLYDLSGKELIPPQFQRINIRKNNIIHSENNYGAGRLYNSRGKAITQHQFTYADDIKEGLILVKLKLDEDSIKILREIMDEEEGSFRRSDMYKYGFVDSTGNIIIPIIYEGAYEFNEGIAPVLFNDKWGLIDKNNEQITEFEYDQIYYAGDNRFSYKRGNLWGLLDLNGREVIPAKYYGANTSYHDYKDYGGESPFIFKNGKAKTSKTIPGFNGDRTTLIDTNGVQLFLYKYRDVEELKGGFFKVMLGYKSGGNAKFGLIDKKGKEIISVQQSGIWWSNAEKVFVVSPNAYKNERVYYDSTWQEVDAPYNFIEREGLRDYKLLSNGYYSARGWSHTVYFTPAGIPLFEDLLK
ncbi:MAG: hypothetical protein ACI8ZM_001623 [Crocinitomix sp.]|jgi:hypothetical protein